MSELHSEASLAYVRTKEAPALPPPASTQGLMGWMRENLVPTPFQAIVTLELRQGSLDRH